jgi:hypothetical protein
MPKSRSLEFSISGSASVLWSAMNNSECSQTIQDYANAVCQGFAKLGARQVTSFSCIPHKLTSDRGVSVLFSTGDQGLGVDDLPVCLALAYN